MKRGLLPYLTPMIALGLASIAALISILGMSKLFAGQATIVMVVMGFIEAGKVIGTSILHKHWKNSDYKIIKWLLLIMVIVTMLITSWGIYGFFTDAYQRTANKLTINESEIGLIDNKKLIFKKNIENIESQIQFKNEQSTKLNNLRSQQEIRLDSLLSKNHFTSAKLTQKQIDEANSDLKKIQDEINVMYGDINNLNDSIGRLDIDILGMQSNNDASSELGPLIYISRIFNTTMDNVINFVMLFIMMVFDPLAIIMVVITGKMWDTKIKEEDVIVVNETPKPTIMVDDVDHGLVDEFNPEDEIITHRDNFGTTRKPNFDVTQSVWDKVRELRSEGKLPTPTQEDIDNEPTALANSGDIGEYDVSVDADWEPNMEVKTVKAKLIKPDNVGETTKSDEITQTWQNILKNRRKNRGGNNITRLGD